MTMINCAGMTAVWRRQLGSLLGNPLGYIFILAFVVASALILFLPNTFFTRNLCDLGLLLNQGGVPIMPLLLAVLLPALAMGVWASEREQGTEEVLLTLPLSLFDAIMGKYLAIVSYFTIALACSLSNVAVLAWQGSPDAGLVLANYVGWWAAGLVFAAWGLLASVLVSIPAIAFIVGALFCGIWLVLAGWADWFDAFNRGVLSIGGLITAVGLAAAGLGLAMLSLASRRWRPGREDQVVVHLLSAVFGLVLVVNIARLAERHGVDADVSVDGVSSLSDESVRILKSVQQPVTVAAFISRDLPTELAPKRKELEDKLKALKRAAGDKVKLEIHYPRNTLDAHAVLATQHYGLRSRKELVDAPGGKEMKEVFLGAAMVSGGRNEKIEYFDPGLSVEYELVRAVRTVGSEKKRVLGVVGTDMELMGGFDQRTFQMRPGWQVVDEWKRQYDVREVGLDGPVPAEIEVLVVAQPSSLTQEQIQVLHDHIWDGRPTLLMEDPLPQFSGAQLAASQPKKSQQQSQFGGPPEGGPQKGDLKPLLRALGVEFDMNSIAWSDYNPSHAFRGAIPRNFVWVRRDQGGMADSPITAGFQALLMPFPGTIRTARDKHPQLAVTPLLQPSARTGWGEHPFTEHVSSGFMGMQQKEPTRWKPSPSDRMPALAVEITGTMPSAFPKPDPDAKPAADAAKPADPATPAAADPAKPAAEGEAKADAAKPEAPPAERTGVASAKPVHVILVADADFAHDAFFQFYRNTGDRYSGDELKFLLELRNIQFIANAVDALAADKDFLALRARNVNLRPLERMDAVLTENSQSVARSIANIEDSAEIEVKTANENFEARLAAIDQRTDLDENAKNNLKEQTRQTAQRSLQVTLDGIKQKTEDEILRINSARQDTIESYRTWVRVLAIGIPFVLLALLAGAVLARRLVREHSNVPASRKRSVA